MTCAVTVGSGWLVVLHDQSVGDQLVVATICSTLRFGTKKTFCVSGSTDYYLFIHFIPIYVCLLAYLFIGFLVAKTRKTPPQCERAISQTVQRLIGQDDIRLK